MALYEDLIDVIQRGNLVETENRVNDLLKKGDAPDVIIKNGIIPALDVVGKKFSEGECFLPEMLIAARASQKGLDILKPLLVKTNYKPRGKVVIGTVEGDLHDIGKNIVAMTLGAAGFQVIDLGADVAPQKFAEIIKTENPEILALSCLLTTTMSSIPRTLDVLREAGLSKSIKVMIGGPPITDDFVNKVGADFRGKDAYEAVGQARRWTKA